MPKTICLNYTFKSCSSCWPYPILQLILLLWLTTAFFSPGFISEMLDFFCSDGPTVMQEFTRLAPFLSVLPSHAFISKLSFAMCSNQQFSYTCLFFPQSSIHSLFSCFVLFLLQIQIRQAGCYETWLSWWQWKRERKLILYFLIDL